MVIVQVNYRRPDMPKADWEARYTDDRAKQFLAVDGLQWKIWLDDSDERRAGGIYLFADRAAAEAYANGPIVARINSEVTKVLELKETSEQLQNDGVSPAGGTPEQFLAMIKTEIPIWRKIVNDLGIKAE